jgi:CRISPR-associated exonuclease Cas4
MAAAFLNQPLVALVLVVGGLAVAVWGARALAARRADATLGALRSIDAGRPAILSSHRYRLTGRPDVLRQLPDGRFVPVELKSRTSPENGPARSHLVQVWAYCLLVEDWTGRSPPFGVLRYADREYRVPWDAEARRDLLAIRADIARPYDGRATPSPARCARCAWVDGCDARVLSR